MPMPLEGIRVIDWTVWQQGPVATMMLGDMGAEVIKIEPRVSGDPGRGIMRIMGAVVGIPGGRNFYFESNNRNKKSITLDLTKEKGKEVVYRLVEKSDVFVQNFRKGVAAKLGLDYATLSQFNPQLIYANATGFGSRGPESDAPTYDLLGQARSGLMAIAQEPGMPPHYVVGGISDQVGAIMLAYGIVLALMAREKLGLGQEVDASLLGSMIWLQNINVASSINIGSEYASHCRARAGNPLWNYYRCSDDKWICLGMLQPDRHWPFFCKAAGIEALEKDARFEDADKRQENCEELISLLDKVFATKPREEWMRLLKEAGDLIFTPINNVSDLATDLQVLANDYVTDFDHPAFGPMKVVGVPVELSKTPGSVRTPAPECGQHTEEVLTDILGYTWDDITNFRDQGVIG